LATGFSDRENQKWLEFFASSKSIIAYEAIITISRKQIYGSSTIKANHPAAFFSLNYIGFNPFTAIDVQHMHLLKFNDVAAFINSSSMVMLPT